jgi:hypothetical protein
LASFFEIVDDYHMDHAVRDDLVPDSATGGTQILTTNGRGIPSKRITTCSQEWRRHGFASRILGAGIGLHKVGSEGGRNSACFRFLELVILITGLLSAKAGGQIQSPGLSQATEHSNPTDSSLRRIELGVDFANIRTDCIGSKGCELPSFGVGAGGSFLLNSVMAIDANVAVTPMTSQGGTNNSGGRHAEYLLGLRAEARGQHYGYFLKAQPGVLRWSHVIRQVVYEPDGRFYFLYGDRKDFVSNISAGFEYSPTARVHIRGEIGDLIRAYSRTSWSNNLQSMAGVYVGLGKPLAWSAPQYDAKKSHGFFDAGNLALMTGSLLGMTADSITTQRFISRGQVEGDPFARPLVKYGWSGQVAAEGLEINAEIWGMYGLHRIHRHWIERIVPVSVALAHGYFAYANDRVNPNAKRTP